MWLEVLSRLGVVTLVVGVAGTIVGALLTLIPGALVASKFPSSRR
jgi:hypothetical protein